MLKKYINPKTLIFAALLIIVLIFSPKVSGLLMVLFASFVFAAALNPFVNKLQDKLKNRAVSAAIVVVSSIIALFALILPIIVMCYKEIELFISLMPQKAQNLYTFITNTKLYGKSLSQFIPMENIANASTNIAQNVLNQSLNITMGVGQTIFIILALTMFIYYILVDRTYLRNKFLEFFPTDLKEKAGVILYNITSRVGNYVRAQVLSMITVGVMVTLEVALLGID